MPWTASQLPRVVCCSREFQHPYDAFPTPKNLILLTRAYRTTNHLERLDPALSRPGRMDVWVEFKNASKWQAEALFRNFFPSTEDDNIVLEGEAEIEGVDLPCPPSPSASGSGSGSGGVWSMSPSFSSSTTSLSTPPPLTPSTSPSPPTTTTTKPVTLTATPLGQFGSKNKAYLPPPVEEHITKLSHSAKPLDAATLGTLAKKFADAIPEEEFSVAALQGYLLKNKSQPEAAANDAGAWVVSEREMKERLRREREEREIKEKLEVCAGFLLIFVAHDSC
jgi:mitochondrial chaperone BCS1